MQSDWKFVHGRYFWRVKYTQKDVVEFSTFSIIPDLPSRPAIYMSMCHPLVIPTWFSLLGFTWNSIPGEARCGVFLRNRVTYRDHLPLDIFGGWHLSISPVLRKYNAEALKSAWKVVKEFLTLCPTILPRHLDFPRYFIVYNEAESNASL